MKLRCAILDDYQRVALAMADWRSLANEVEVRVLHEHVADPDALAAAIGDCEIVVVMRERTPFDRAVLERLPNLRLLVTTGMRNASIDLAAAKERGVTVSGTQSLGYPAVELTWALLLALARRLPAESALFRSGGPWQTTIGADLNGRRLGIVGLGKLGARVATIAKAFEMDVTAWSRNLTPERCAEVGVEHAGTLERLLETSDFVTIHLVLGERTRRLIGARELAMMKSTAYLVNTARGPIVDEAALVEALRERRIAGAGLDVFDVEPLPRDHPLRGLDNVVATPHVGYVTEANYRVFFRHAIEDIVAWRRGVPVRLVPA
jgi:phosphoglycerate dehydrogenase-like enzyme